MENGNFPTNVQTISLKWYDSISEFAWQTSPVTCPGDSGGPVICYEYSDVGDSNYALHGTVIGGTNGRKCADRLDTYVAFFTKVKKFNDLMERFTYYHRLTF
jgi:secreted trypsin-like serine protease